MGLLSGVDDFTGWALLQNNGEAIQTAYAATTPTASDVTYLKSVLPTLKTPAALLDNYRALSIVTSAFGLGSQVNQTGILSKLMTQDPKASSSLAQQLSDNRYLMFAQAMSTYQPNAVFTSASIASLTAAYALSAPGGTATDAQVRLFQTIAPTLKTAADVVANPTAAAFVATAFGVPTLATQRNVLSNLLTQDPTASNSVAQQSGNKGYLALATALSTFKPLYSSTPAGIAAITTGYQDDAFRTAVGADNPALQEAMYFQKTALGATSLSQLMADPALLNVVRVASGLPTAFGNLDYTQQVAMLSSRVDMKQFSTPAGVADYIQKYFAMDQLNGTASGTGFADPLMALFGNGSSDGSSSDSTASLVSAKSLNLIL
jgi:hypothetical protein